MDNRTMTDEELERLAETAPEGPLRTVAAELVRLRRELRRGYAFLDQALNEGEGVYRP